MKKTFIASWFLFFVMVGNVVFAQDMSMSKLDHKCVDAEYYFDVLEYSNAKVLGYVPSEFGLFDRQGNPMLSEIIKEGRDTYEAEFNAQEGKVCILKAPKNKHYDIHSYDEYNPWD